MDSGSVSELEDDLGGSYAARIDERDSESEDETNGDNTPPITLSLLARAKQVHLRQAAERAAITNCPLEKHLSVKARPAPVFEEKPTITHVFLFRGHIVSVSPTLCIISTALAFAPACTFFTKATHDTSPQALPSCATSSTNSKAKKFHSLLKSVTLSLLARAKQAHLWQAIMLNCLSER
ncbi:hypothetical protein EV702DRAFT_1046153 [Suillus placidus]|uniref:Uncharacterized protein n=1 Tax=Suillus placidus TaxID=48579 RepID=A0A9P6ZTP0_9AGAM|nr:hypothetical protein EV702DRAFT_1046153 [Suillus placidus]